MPTLKQVVEQDDTSAGRAFALATQALIVLSLAAFSLETLPTLPPIWRSFLDAFETLCVVAFSAEYVLRVYVARPRKQYVLSFYGLADLAAILPYFLGRHVDLRSVRAIRLLRLVRILKLARYSAAVRRFQLALRIAKEEIVLFVGATVILLYLAAVGIYYFEHDAQPQAFASVFHSLWWAVATLTTVGYGDIYPITVGGRVFTFVILLVGLGVISVPAGLIASALGKARQMEGGSPSAPEAAKPDPPT